VVLGVLGEVLASLRKKREKRKEEEGKEKMIGST
jgi:hypothetical protein